MRTSSVSQANSREPGQPTGVQVGECYRLRRQSFGGYDHRSDYDEGKFIHVRVLCGPDRFGSYECTTRGEDGQHLGPGGGWSPEHEKKCGIRFNAHELEAIKQS
jgi:hypothetical protein